MSDFQNSKRNFLKTVTLASAAFGASLLSPYVKAAEAAGSTLKSKKRKPGSADSDEWDVIRTQFSLTHDRVYFNNGTIGPSPEVVLTTVVNAMKAVELRSEHREEDGKTLREKLAQFLGVTSDEIALTHNTTEAINIVAQGLPLSSGDEVIITTHEHVGNALPWLNRARIDGIVLKTFSPASTAAAVLSQIEALITAKTKVIAVPHVSCTTGQVFPIDEIVKLAHGKKIWCFVDGAHSTGMLPLNLAASGVDFFASCGHKWLCGPKGTGYLYVKKSLLDTVNAKFVGANSDIGWTLGAHSGIAGFKPTAQRYDYGSQNTALYAGLSSAVDYFTQIGMQKISDYGCDLAKTLQEGLLARAGIEMLTPTEDRSRAMMISFRFKDASKTSPAFAAYAAKNGFRVRQVPEAGLNAIRVSTHLYNSKSEVAGFLTVIDSFLKA